MMNRGMAGGLAAMAPAASMYLMNQPGGAQGPAGGNGLTLPPGGGIQAPKPVDTGMPIMSQGAAPGGDSSGGGMPGFPLAWASPIVAALMQRYGSGGMGAGAMPTALGGMLPGGLK